MGRQTMGAAARFSECVRRVAAIYGRGHTAPPTSCGVGAGLRAASRFTCAEFTSDAAFRKYGRTCAAADDPLDDCVRSGIVASDQRSEAQRCGHLQRAIFAL